MERAETQVPVARAAPAASPPSRTMAPLLRPAPAIAVAAVLVAAISVADFTTGFEVRIAILYLAPVSLVTWAAGRPWGFAFALVSTLAWLASAMSRQDAAHGAYVYWDGAVLGATLVLFVELLSRLASALEHSDERFVRVLEGIDAAVYVIDDDRAVLYANPRLARLVGDAGPPTVAGIAARFVAHGDRASAPPRPAAWPDGTELSGVAGGRRYVVQARDIPWVDRRRAHLVVLTDVTDQRVAEELKLDHQEAMHRTARIVALTEATSAMAHELNQPLLAIVGYNAACLRLIDDAGGEADGIREAMDKCRAQAVRAGEILRRLRELTRRRSPEFVPCNLNASVRKALAWIGHDLERARVTVELDLDPRVPGVPGDRVLIEQVILNLVHNAIEAMQAMPPAERRLRIATTVDPDGVRVSVADRGHGIAPEVSERLYSSFFTTKAGGLGLGLSICRSIVEMHGGRIGHAAGEGGGAVFHFVLPRAAA